MSRWRQPSQIVEPKPAQGEYLEHVLGLDGPALIVFRAEGVDYGPFLQAVGQVLKERDDVILLAEANIADLTDYFNKLRQERAYHAYDVDRLPALGLIRDGKLVATFNPVLSVSAKAMVKEIEQQFRRFMATFVDYDPEKLTFNHKK